MIARMPLVVPDTDQTPDLLDLETGTLRIKAAEWAAREHGLRAPFEVSEPERVEFPGGYAFTVTVRETEPHPGTGKRRAGTAQFDRTGRPVMWNLDVD